MRWWHGGIPNLQPGDLLLPPSITGTERNLAKFSDGQARADLVHLTSDRASAKAFAAAYPDGALYVAEPIGDTHPDPDAPDLAIRCQQARVVQVYDPCVRWAERGQRWLNPLFRGTP